MQRVYGVRHSLLWPGQFAMIDIFKFVTAWCLLLSLGAVIAALLAPVGWGIETSPNQAFRIALQQGIVSLGSPPL